LGHCGSNQEVPRGTTLSPINEIFLVCAAIEIFDHSSLVA
jgi:hypothetical protein